MGDALAQHHLGLERMFETIVAGATHEDPLLRRRAWDAFAAELLNHLELEEKDLFPRFERIHVEAAETLRAEHEAIREKLLELGVALDLHQLQPASIDDFVARLRAHALREDLLLYPWIERHLSHDSWHALGRDLSDGDALVRSASSGN
jgi:hemerythrin-like domain-containing protein